MQEVVMRKELPVRPNLEHLKSQAKDLLEAARRGERTALERFTRALPAARGADGERLAAMELALHDAQSVIAREYGFASWSELKAHVARSNLSPETLRALMQRHLTTAPPEEVQRAMLAAAAEPLPKLTEMPRALPLIPLRNAMLAVGAVAPVMVGRATSIAAVETARRSGDLLAVFSQTAAEAEAPVETELYPVGCLVSLRAQIPDAEHGSWIVVRALAWIRLDAIVQKQPYVIASIEPFIVAEENSEAVMALEQKLRERVQVLVTAFPDAERLLELTKHMTPLELADATIANIWCSLEAKAEYAKQSNLAGRLQYVLALLENAA
jgi:Lon protease-like protein